MTRSRPSSSARPICSFLTGSRCAMALSATSGAASGFFAPPRLSAEPQPVLAVHFGDDTNVNEFSLEVNALAPTNVMMFQVDRTNKTLLEETAGGGQHTALGAVRAG